ncbi:MAG TPA: DUF58 domain-containing protein [Armatimonadota bacterium]|nr:DUF58 domain-containing protein [Armatimonadota bacterium]HPP73829.1 DUF58 domain-containing protein [Armatimonadota bacterium]
MIITTRLIVLLVLGALPFALSGGKPLGIVLGCAYLIFIWIIAAVDYRRTPKALAVEVERICDEKLSLGAENAISIRLRNRTRSELDLKLRDEPPYLFSIEGNVAQVKLKPRAQKEIAYHVKPHARGDFDFGDIYLRINGPLGLVVRQYRIPASQAIKVYPNLLDIRKYDLLLRRGRTIELANRRTRIYGRGTEFESLREYVPDDEFRQVDWKASARRGKLISRQYQVERSQNIMILLDAGRTMSVRVEDMTKLDFSINAALMLAYVAASGDDKVGLLTFSDKVDGFLPPNKGRSQALAIMQALYNVPLTTMESDYAGAFLYLARRWRKRSLIVVFTDLLDPESSRQIITHLRSLAANHLCMCVAISDTNILEAARRTPESAADVYEKAAAVEVLHERKQAIAQLERSGVVVVDSEPGTLSPAVINHYLQIKSKVQL